MVSSNASEKGTTHSHTVQRAYLDKFANDKKLYGKSNKDARIFELSTKDASVINNIYELEENISENDLGFYRQMPLVLSETGMTDEENKFLIQISAFLNNDFKVFMSDTPQIILEKLRKFIDEGTFKKNQEELYTYYEENFISIYELLTKKDAAFYNNSIHNQDDMASSIAIGITKTSNFLYRKNVDLLCRLLNQQGLNDLSEQLKQDIKKASSCIESELEEKFPFYNKNNFNIFYFLTYITSQIFRTGKLLQARDVLEKNNVGNYNAKNIIILMCHHAIYRLCRNLITDRHKIIFINATDNSEFITSDNPIVNLSGSYKKDNYSDMAEIELYYPLSPKLSMLFTNRSCYKDVDEIQALEEDVLQYNQAIYNTSDKFVYAKKQVSLLDLK